MNIKKYILYCIILLSIIYCVLALPPNIDYISDFNLNEDFGSFELDLSANISDDNGTDADILFEVDLNDSSVFSLAVNNATDVFTFTSLANASGVVNVSVFVYDLENTSNFTSFDVYVAQVNDQPYWDNNSLPNNTITITEDIASQNISIGYQDYFRDVEDDQNPTLSIISDNETDVTCAMDTGDIECSPVNNFTGVFILTINGSDSGGLSALTSFEINVSNVNDLPEMPYLLYPLNFSSLTTIPILNWTNASDVDGDIITYYLEVDNNNDFSSPEYVNKSISEQFTNSFIEFDDNQQDGIINMTDNVLLLHLNENGSINDSSGNGRNGTLFNNPTYIQSGKLNGAYEFDGNDDFINLSSMQITEDKITVSAWVYMEDSPQDYETIMGDTESDAWDNGWILHYEKAGDKFRFLINSYNNGAEIAPTFNEWVHLVGTYDGSTIKIYKNGVKGTDDTASGNINFFGRFTIAQAGTWGEELEGKLDEIAIWNRTLSESEILDIYNLQKQSYNIISDIPSGLVDDTYYWRVISSDSENSSIRSINSFTLDTIVDNEINIDLDKPIDRVIINSFIQEFTYTPTSEVNISNCTLNLGRDIDKIVNTTIINGTLNSFDIRNLTIGLDYRWNVTCTNINNNFTSSENRYLFVKPDESNGGGSIGSQITSIFDDLTIEESVEKAKDFVLSDNGKIVIGVIVFVFITYALTKVKKKRKR